MSEVIDVVHLMRMAHSPVRNYVVPGMTSWLVGAPSAHGLVRMLETEREIQEAVTPHSHRFDFESLVVRGSVRNLLWTPALWKDRSGADLYGASRLRYGGQPGSYTKEGAGVGWWSYEETSYLAGQRYGMTSKQVHSIFFGRDTLVLFFEGPSSSDETLILEPYVNGKVVPTFEVRPWMFERDEAGSGTKAPACPECGGGRPYYVHAAGPLKGRCTTCKRDPEGKA